MAVQTIAVIKQADLQQIHDLQVEIADKQLRLDGITEQVKQQLFAKAPIERGRFDALLSYTRMHNVPWKQVVIEQLGQAYAEAVRKATPTVTRCELKVIEHAIPPLWKHLESEMVE
ncbi:hypothetical protein SBA5_580040 [Candidatus Sulfotelmatomonas gaucii]|uniref:Uncharacterized protein n=1 Tax=Candidatus Sulfuritelmatomonas gaucii TaxID=2043161 RepID=A0A2N9LVB0_9BACT|nr:hypothetical protein SBA5_580040 [Candidatus Sulfotelmatomonas gaucii]